MRAMYIGLNAHLLAPENSYRAAGIHNAIHHLLLHLPEVAPAEWQFTALVNPAYTQSYDGIQRQPGPFVTTSPLRRIMWEQFIQPFALRRFDLIHALAFVSPLINPRPSVVTIYDLTFIRYPERLSRARRVYLQALTPRSCRLARRVLAISESTKADLVELLAIPAEKIDVTPLGYDQVRFRPLPADQVAAFRRDKDLPESFWLFLGTLEPRKNLLTLLEAYAQLPARERPLLVLAGAPGWDYAPIYAAIDRLRLNDSVLLPGFVPVDEMALWYNAASAFLYPSVFEGFGLPVLEAMACGTPVITSDISSLPEVASGAGLLMPPHDVDAWAAALVQARDDAEWRTQASAAGLARAQYFTWRRTAELTIASYRRALGQV